MTSENNKFHYFNYYIVTAFSEFLNDIKQYSYKKLTDSWWQSCYIEIESIIMNPHIIPTKINYMPTNIKYMPTEIKYTPTEIKYMLIEKVLNEFSNNFLTSEQTEALNVFISLPYKSYYAKYHSIHHCDNIDCEGDCGVLLCGCIDICRSRCGFNRYRLR